jgi:hypothetical protein
VFLFWWHTWERHGIEVVFPFVVIPIIAIQSVIWFFVWYGVLSLFKKLTNKWRHKP